MKIKKSLKNKNFDTISHARTQKREVPEEAKIGRTIIGFGFQINLMTIKKSLKNLNFDTISHARTQKRGVPEEAKIGRTITRFGFWINLMKIKNHSKTKTLILFRMRGPGSLPKWARSGS